MKKFLQRLRQGAVGILLGANAFTIILLWGSILRTEISPASYPILSLLCLAFPVFLCFNVLFCIVWAFVRPRFLIIPMMALLLALPYIFDYCPIHFTSQGEKDDNTLCIISFNTGGVKKDNFDVFTEYVRRMDPDIICLQESNAAWKDDSLANVLLNERLPHRWSSGGRELFTRFPIEEAKLDIPFPTRTNGFSMCWIEINGQRTLLFNVHLESNHLEATEKDDYREAISELGEEQLRKSGLVLADKLTVAAAFRGQQTDALCEWLDQNPEQSIILCGDFNDTPISYTCQQLNRHLRSAFCESGSGVGYSYNQKGFPVRIDHIFYSPNWRSVHTFVDHSIEVSDHYPLVTYIQQIQ